jgi:RNA polymerase sigma-70 factor (ECF subfamily)
MKQAEAVICVVGAEAGPAVLEELEHWGGAHDVAVIGDGRRRERRRSERRAYEWSAENGPPPTDLRRVRSHNGRRVADRRRELVRTAPPAPLPAIAGERRDAISFFHPLEPDPRRRRDVHAARLIVRIQSGDHRLFDRLYELYLPTVRRYLETILRSKEEAEDVTQEVFVRADPALDSYELREASPHSWLLAIARRQGIDRLRRRRLATIEPHDLEGLRTDEALEPYMPGWLDDADLLMLFERLPLLQQRVLLLRYLLDLSGAEIARALDLSPENVRQLQLRALAFLRDRLVSLGREPQERRAHLAMREQLRRRWIPRPQRLAFSLSRAIF